MVGEGERKIEEKRNPFSETVKVVDCSLQNQVLVMESIMGSVLRSIYGVVCFLGLLNCQCSVLKTECCGCLSRGTFFFTNKTWKSMQDKHFVWLLWVEV